MKEDNKLQLNFLDLALSTCQTLKGLVNDILDV